MGSNGAHSPPFPFSPKSALSPTQTWLFPTKSVQSVHGGLPARDTFAESSPRRACHLPRYFLGKEKKKSKQLQLGFQEKWGLGTKGWR